MKFNAIVQDGSREKDLVNIYYLLEKRSLSELLISYKAKNQNVNFATAKKDLLYHNDVGQTRDLGLIRKDLSLKEIVKRLQHANHDAEKVFKTELGKLKIKKSIRSQNLL